MDLISRERAIDALNMNGCCGMGITYLLDCDSVPAVPLDKLCEWLQENASLTHGTLISAAGWKYELTRWMEEQDAKEET